MAKLKNFLSFIEISTKLASFLPFLLAVFFACFTYGKINVYSTLLFLFSMVLFDLAVTAINNYIDRREAKREGHYSRFTSLVIIFSLCLVSGAVGIYLTYLHGLVILFFGAVCFAAGIGYSYGPFPISKSPYGEVVSGLIQGFCLPFMAVYINAPEGMYITYSFMNPSLSIQLNLLNLIKFVVVMFPLACCIANIMLANNISDIEKDKPVRYTFPRHLGVKRALIVFEALYYTGYLSIIVAVIFGWVPAYSLAVLLTLIIVNKNIKQFQKKQIKSETFLLSIQNFVLIIVSYIFCMGIGALVNAIV